MRRTLWTFARLLSGVAILAVLVWRLGIDPFLDAVSKIDAWSLVVATGVAALSTVCCAWRWHAIAEGLGVGVPVRTAVASYYRSQFLNTMLPGGVLGDVHRAVRHGRDVGDLGRGLRAVALERGAGQVVQIALAIIVLLVVPSPEHRFMPVVMIAVTAVALTALFSSLKLAHGGSSIWARSARLVVADVRDGLLPWRTWPGVVLASTAVVSGHAICFLIAARIAGSTASVTRLLPLAMLALVAMGLPTNIAGWGPREGVAAWAFGISGLGAAQGVVTAVVYGVMVIVASLPGAGVLVAESLHRATRRHPRADTLLSWVPPADGSARRRAARG